MLIYLYIATMVVESEQFQKTFEQKEGVNFVRQMIRKINGILSECEKRGKIVEHLLRDDALSVMLQKRDNLEILVQRYG